MQSQMLVLKCLYLLCALPPPNRPHLLIQRYSWIKLREGFDKDAAFSIVLTFKHELVKRNDMLICWLVIRK